MNAIETRAITKQFKDGKESTWAINGIDLKIKKNQIFGLLGPNGAGKTTLIYLLSNLVLPTSGKAKVLGYDVWTQGDELRKKTGICMGGTRFFWDLTPKEILEFYGMLYGVKRAVRKERIDYLIDKLDITEFRKKRFGNLSTGMRQKVAVAKAFINDPQILFLDEPTSGLDVEVAIDVRNFIMEIMDEKELTVILTSHHLQEVEELCKKIAIIKQGKIIANGNISAIKSKLNIADIVHLCLNKYENLDFVKRIPGVIGYNVTDGLSISVDSGLKRINNITEAFKKQKINIMDLEIRKASLEDTFLNIIGRKGKIMKRTNSKYPHEISGGKHV